MLKAMFRKMFLSIIRRPTHSLANDFVFAEVDGGSDVLGRLRHGLVGDTQPLVELANLLLDVARGGRDGSVLVVRLPVLGICLM